MGKWFNINTLTLIRNTKATLSNIKLNQSKFKKMILEQDWIKIIISGVPEHAAFFYYPFLHKIGYYMLLNLIGFFKKKKKLLFVNLLDAL